MGKGDWRRPCQVPKEEADANFERVFGKKKLNVMSDEDREAMVGDPWGRGTDIANDRDREAGGDVPADGHDSGNLPTQGKTLETEGPHDNFWIGPGYRGEYQCPHGVGHGNHIHGCDGCCSRPDFPLRGKK